MYQGCTTTLYPFFYICFMKNICTLLAAVLLTATTYAQIGINNENPDASAALDITSTTGGLLVPRMTETQRDAISSRSNWINDIPNRWYSRFLLLQW